MSAPIPPLMTGAAGAASVCEGARAEGRDSRGGRPPVRVVRAGGRGGRLATRCGRGEGRYLAVGVKRLLMGCGRAVIRSGWKPVDVRAVREGGQSLPVGGQAIGI